MIPGRGHWSQRFYVDATAMPISNSQMDGDIYFVVVVFSERFFQKIEDQIRDQGEFLLQVYGLVINVAFYLSIMLKLGARSWCFERRSEC